jgi:hypothetical protein
MAADLYLSLPAAGELIGTLASELGKAREKATADAKAQRLDRPPAVALETLRHRLFIDAERFNAITGLQITDVPFCVVLDLRFSTLFDQVRCQASVSVWSAPPRHPRHRPQELRNDAKTSLEVPVTQCQQAFELIAKAAEALLGQYMHRVHINVFEYEYTLPVFWVAVPDSPPPDALDYLDLRRDGANTAGWVEWTSERTQELLKVQDARDHSLTRSVLNGRLFVLRRVMEPSGHLIKDSPSVPTYLLLPGGPELLEKGSEVFEPTETLAKRRAYVEFAAADVITQLTDLEAAAANSLQLGQRDLEIWSNHLRVYNAVVERGAFLWDALSTHLMIRWGGPFEKAHNAVDLLHQVLQQAVADLRHIATLTHQVSADIHQSAASLQDSYDQRIGERTFPGEQGLRAALTDSGLFGRASRLGDEVISRADRVKLAYDDLLKAIAGAFDERRVRELDGTQKAGFFVGFFAAFFGLVTVLDAIIDMKPKEAESVPTIVKTFADIDQYGFWASVGIGGLVLLFLAGLFLQVRRIGKLGTLTFRDLYHGRGRWHPRRWWLSLVTKRWPSIGLWRFLKDTSTDHQKLLRIRTEDSQWSTKWSEHDQKCAADLARISDTAKDLKKTRRHNHYKRDIKGLSRLIEQWGVHSLCSPNEPGSCTGSICPISPVSTDVSH